MVGVIITKYAQDSGFCSGTFPRSPSHLEDFQNHLRQHTVPWEIFKIPFGLQGIWVKIPPLKLEFDLHLPRVSGLILHLVQPIYKG